MHTWNGIGPWEWLRKTLASASTHSHSNTAVLTKGMSSSEVPFVPPSCIPSEKNNKEWPRHYITMILFSCLPWGPNKKRPMGSVTNQSESRRLRMAQINGVAFIPQQGSQSSHFHSRRGFVHLLTCSGIKAPICLISKGEAWPFPNIL